MRYRSCIALMNDFASMLFVLFFSALSIWCKNTVCASDLRPHDWNSSGAWSCRSFANFCSHCSILSRLLRSSWSFSASMPPRSSMSFLTCMEKTTFISLFSDESQHAYDKSVAQCGMNTETCMRNVFQPHAIHMRAFFLTLSAVSEPLASFASSNAMSKRLEASATSPASLSCSACHDQVKYLQVLKKHQSWGVGGFRHLTQRIWRIPSVCDGSWKKAIHGCL